MSNITNKADDIASAVLECRDVFKTYTEGPEDVHVLQALNFQVCAGERVAVVGSSGSGKTTLLNVLAGLDRPTSGDIFIDGLSINALSDKALAQLRNEKLGFVYQLHHLLAEFTALENVAMPLLMRKKMGIKAIYACAETMLEKVGLAKRICHKPSALSGGERQRVAIARALVTSPSLVLMDEPTGNLDQLTAEGIHDLMLELSLNGSTSFVVVTHDQKLAGRLDKTYKLVSGCFSG